MRKDKEATRRNGGMGKATESYGRLRNETEGEGKLCFLLTFLRHLSPSSAFFSFLSLSFAFFSLLPLSFAGESVSEKLLRGKTLMEMGLEQESLAVFLEVVKADPQNGQALNAIGVLVKRSKKEQDAISKLAAAPAKSEIALALDDAVGEMLKGVKEPDVRMGFLRAGKLFKEGKLLLSCDVFFVIKERDPDYKWLKEEINRWLYERLPKEIERRRKAGFYGISAASEYENAFSALRAGKWESAYAALGRWRQFSRAEKLPDAGKFEAETAILEKRLKERVILVSRKNRQESWLEEATILFDRQDYGRSIDMLETLLPARPVGGLKKRAEDALGWAYGFLALTELTEKAEAAFSAEKYMQALEPLFQAQELYPGNKKVLVLLAKVLDKAKTLTDRRERQAAEKILARRGVIAPVTAIIAQNREAPRKEPTRAERVLADAHYLEGISAYAKGEMYKACSEWNKALELVPGHLKSKKALERLSAEINE